MVLPAVVPKDNCLSFCFEAGFQGRGRSRGVRALDAAGDAALDRWEEQSTAWHAPMNSFSACDNQGAVCRHCSGLAHRHDIV